MVCLFSQFFHQLVIFITKNKINIYRARYICIWEIYMAKTQNKITKPLTTGYIKMKMENLKAR